MQNDTRKVFKLYTNVMLLEIYFKRATNLNAFCKHYYPRTNMQL